MSEQALLSSQALSAYRYVAQGLVPNNRSKTPLEAVELLACAQGQHLGGVIAALAIRSTGEAGSVEDAFNAGLIVRGYPMRGTVFAVSAADVQWMTALGGIRSVRSAARRREELGLDDELMARITDAIIDILATAPNHAVSRPALSDALEQRGFTLSGGQRYHVLFTLIASGELVYGPLSGAEHLVVSTEEWLAPSGTLEALFNGDELAATGEWLRRYLVGHGPATLRDFSWWTKLPLGQVRKAMAAYLAEAELESYGVDAAGETLWARPSLAADVGALSPKAIAEARLLPPFDELLLGYPNRTMLVTDEHHRKIDTARNGVFKPVVYSKGRLVATWSSAGSGKNRRLALVPFDRPLAQRTTAKLERDYAQYPHRGN